MDTLVTDLDTIKQLAAEKHDDFEVLRYQLEAFDELSDAPLDAYVDGLAAPIVAAIDCTQCANCCRGLDVYLTPTDVERLAAGLDQMPQKVENEFVDHARAEQVGEWGMLRRSPCVFLNQKLCTVYEHRPESCRAYPAFTPDFRWTLTDTIAGAGRCPIIYNVLCAMLDQVDELYTIMGGQSS